MVFVVYGKSRDRDKSIPCPPGILDDLCTCLSYPPRVSTGVGSHMANSLATGRTSLSAFGVKLCSTFPDAFPQ